MNPCLKEKFLLSMAQEKKRGNVSVISRKAFLSIYFLILFLR